MYDCNNKSQSRLIEHRTSMKSISENIVFTVKSEQSFRVEYPRKMFTWTR